MQPVSWIGGGVDRGALPEKIRVDNGTGFTSKRLDQWAYLRGVRLDFSRSGKPTDNGLIEAFNGRLRAECLNENWFLNLDDAKEEVGSGVDISIMIDLTAPWATCPQGIRCFIRPR